MVGFRAWSFHITFASLPVIVGGLLFGPVEGMLIAAIGEFFNQTLSYGVTPTTVLWLIPPAVQGAGGELRRTDSEEGPRSLDERPVLCYVICMAAALCTTVVNTLVMYLDSVIMGILQLCLRVRLCRRSDHLRHSDCRGGHYGGRAPGPSAAAAGGIAPSLRGGGRR